MDHPRRPQRSWSIFIAMAGALLMLWGMVHYDARAGEEMALGKGTASKFAERQGAPVHIHLRADFDALADGAKARGGKHQVLWLGNSQLHAINQIEDGQEPAPALLFDALKPKQVDVVTASFPNANLQEHYVATLKLLELLPRVDVVLLPVVFDDLRETGIRTDLAPLLTDAPVKTSLTQTVIGKTILATAESQQVGQPEPTRKQTMQDRSEEHLDAFLSRHSSLWRGRERSRALIFAKGYELRNWLFRIDAQSKRPMVRPRYDHNMLALEALMNLAQTKGFKLVVYIAPLRSDIETPYIQSEYEAFKQDIEARARKAGVAYINIGDVVSGEFWGETGDATQLDFMHFRFGGHQLLAESMTKEVLKQLEIKR